MQSLLDLLPDRNTENSFEIYEKHGVLLSSNSPFPAVSIGHGACSGFIFIARDKDTPPSELLVMHSSLGLFDYTSTYQPKSQVELLEAFLDKNRHQELLLLPIQRKTRSSAMFLDHATGISDQKGIDMIILDPVELDIKSGWHFLVDAKTNTLAIQIGGCEYAENAKIQTHDLTEIINKNMPYNPLQQWRNRQSAPAMTQTHSYR